MERHHGDDEHVGSEWELGADRADNSTKDSITSGAMSRRHSASSSRSNATSVRESRADREPSLVTASSIVHPEFRTTLEKFVETLQQAELDGPVLLIGIPEKIGQGGQFYVYKQQVGFPGNRSWHGDFVAIKRPKFPTNSAAQIDLADRQAQRSLNHVYHEIKALTDKRLKIHPNIVKLLSWTYGNTEWDGPFGLVLELANTDLEMFLKESPNTQMDTKSKLCHDIASAMSAIHDADFVHGDLKPANVLLFEEDTGPRAKLADFGFSNNENLQVTGGTPGWQAPEKFQSREADCFSYGLVIWSVFFLNGCIPPVPLGSSSKELAMRDLGMHGATFDPELYTQLQEALQGLLQDEKSKRSCFLGHFFEYAKETQPSSDRPMQDPHSVYNFVPPRFTWEVPTLANALLRSLHDRLRERPQVSQSMPSNILVAIGLHLTLRPLSDPQELRKLVFDVLELSARRGNPVACALAPRVARRTDENAFEILQWLIKATSMGSPQARDELRKLDHERAVEAMKIFRAHGGYIMQYWDIDHVPDKEAAGDGILHWLAAFGSHQELTIHLELNSAHDLDSLTKRGETALFIACVRGSWEHAATLLDKGADPTIRCTQYGITCLHWCFAFEPELSPIAVQKLVQAGAQIDALVTKEFPFLHLPFVLPSGSPLHWAIATSSHDAIRALIDNNADPLLRNGSDPYMYDDRFRHLYTIGGPDGESRTDPNPACLGLTPLDLAAIYRDAYIFKMIESRGQTVDMNSADDEGCTVLHRLATNQVFRTRRKSTYRLHLFQSAEDTRLKVMIEVIARLGGDLERLTSSAALAKQPARYGEGVSVQSYTPLMLAMLESDYELIEALVSCGASVHTQNTQGATALFFTSHRARFEQADTLGCLQFLVTKGADVNHYSMNGKSALITASESKMLDIFEYLLSTGANITDSTCPSNRQTGRSVFASFASIDEGTDEAVLQILKRYVLESPAEAARKQVICGGDSHGQTLLHQFASRAMPQCVEALLAHGASANAMERIWQYIDDGGTRKEKSWHQTPLDTLAVVRGIHEGNMLNRKEFSPSRFEAIRRRWDKVTKILEMYNGRLAAEEALIEVCN